jgi:hypothetical protein
MDAKEKTECTAICREVLLPAMQSFAERLEAAEIFAPSPHWRVRCEEKNNRPYCVCKANVQKEDPDRTARKKAIGFVVETTIAVNHPSGKPARVQVQVQCYPASSATWRKQQPEPLLRPPHGVVDVFDRELGNLNKEDLDRWHTARLEDCAKACASWFEKLPRRGA